MVHVPIFSFPTCQKVLVRFKKTGGNTSGNVGGNNGGNVPVHYVFYMELFPLSVHCDNLKY